MRRLLFAILIPFLFVSCMYKRGSGNIITQTREMEPFKALKVGGGFNVEIKKGSPENITIEADDNLVKYIDTKVVDNELRISLQHINATDAHLKIFVTASEINRVSTSAGAQVNVKDGLKSDGTITLIASSGSNINSSLDAPEIKTVVSGGAEMTLSGRTKDFHAESSSGSSIVASDLLTENGYVDASSGGNVHVYASVSLEASASSGANITYKGAATNIKKSESSGGRVEKDN